VGFEALPLGIFHNNGSAKPLWGFWKDPWISARAVETNQRVAAPSLRHHWKGSVAYGDPPKHFSWQELFDYVQAVLIAAIEFRLGNGTLHAMACKYLFTCRT
jgi:hypothetical protein